MGDCVARHLAALPRGAVAGRDRLPGKLDFHGNDEQPLAPCALGRDRGIPDLERSTGPEYPIGSFEHFAAIFSWDVHQEEEGGRRVERAIGERKPACVGGHFDGTGGCVVELLLANVDSRHLRAAQSADHTLAAATQVDDSIFILEGVLNVDQLLVDDVHSPAELPEKPENPPRHHRTTSLVCRACPAIGSRPAARRQAAGDQPAEARGDAAGLAGLAVRRHEQTVEPASTGHTAIKTGAGRRGMPHSISR